MKILVDYEGLATNATTAMRKVTQLLLRAGLQVVEASCDGKTRRVASQSYREVQLTFVDSQTLTLKVKATGDVYEVLINGKKVPVSGQDDPAKAVAELAKMLDTGRAKFQKRLAALQMKLPPGAKTAAPKLREVLIEQIAEVDTQINAATEELAALQGN